MRQNPVYSREMKVSARSPRFPLILSLFNGILCLAALINMYSVVLRVRTNATIQYSSFMDLYEFVTSMEFLLLMFIVPAVTASSISGERERHTLELMFTTKIRPVDIVIGKLASAFTHLMILVFSSLPVLMLTFIYGSISSQDLFLLLFSYVTVALYCGSLGIFASSLMKRSTFSNVITYGIMLVLVVGTYMLNVFLLRISETEINMMVLGAGETIPEPTSGAAVYLLLANPAITFAQILEGQVAGGGGNFKIRNFLGSQAGNLITDHWVFFSLILQLVLSAIFIWGAVFFLEPVRRQKKADLQSTR